MSEAILILSSSLALIENHVALGSLGSNFTTPYDANPMKWSTGRSPNYSEHGSVCVYNEIDAGLHPHSDR